MNQASKTNKQGAPKRKKQQLSRKINARLILFLFIVLAGLTLFNAVKNYNKEIWISEELVARDSEVLSHEIANAFDAAASSMTTLEEIIEHEMELKASDRSRDGIARAITAILHADEHLYGIGVFFEPNAFDGRDSKYLHVSEHSTSKGRFAVYGYRENGEVVAGASEDMEQEGAHDYYFDGIKTGEEFLSQPYTMAIDGKDVSMIT